MISFDEIERDAKAGTPGDWERTPNGMGKGLSEFSIQGHGRRGICSTGGYEDGKDGTFEENKANARRIARLPDLERIALAANELADSVDSLLEYMRGHDDGCGKTSAALTAFREATQ